VVRGDEAARTATNGARRALPTQPRPVISQGLLVVGMHRSGTSAVSQLLSSGGLANGSPDLQMLANVANPAGYAELRPIVEFNDMALAATGSYWDAPSARPARQGDVDPSLVNRGRALLQEHIDGTNWIVKDPRIALLLPLWRRILVDRFVAVVTLRAAHEVAWSLSVRDGLSASLSVALWRSYYRHLAVGLAGLPVVAVDYPSLTEHPASVTSALIGALVSLGAIRDVDEPGAAAAIFPELRRDTAPATFNARLDAVTIEGVVPGLFANPVNTYARFDLVPTEPEPWEDDLLEEHRLRREFENRAVDTSERTRFAAERDSVAAERDSVAAERDSVAAERDRLLLEVEDVRSRIVSVARDADVLRALRDGLLAANGELAAELSSAHVALGTLAADQREEALRRAQCEVDLANAAAEHGLLEEQSRVLLGEVARLTGLIDAYDASKSWRLMSPGRFAGRQLRRLVGRA